MRFSAGCLNFSVETASFYRENKSETKVKTIFSENFEKGIDNPERVCYTNIVDGKSMNDADLAHLVERDLAKVEVAGSRPVIRSIRQTGFTRVRSVLFVKLAAGRSAPFLASVAQLVEQGTENPRVVGSIPIGGTFSRI